MKKSIKLKDLYPLIQSILPICQKIHDNGGICYLVGGTVRDLVMHQAGYEVVLPKKNNDIDIEIHNLSLASIEKIFEAFGSVYTIGRRFGVLRVDSFNVDWSLPRTDSVGRKPLVTIDPFLPIEKACGRRDITINALAIDLRQLTTPSNNPKQEIDIIDPFNGYTDIQTKTLRAVDPDKFGEDPLRYFRVVQFIGRFEMVPNDALTELCSQLSLKDPGTDKALAKERIQEEFKKLFLYSLRPSIGLAWLSKTNLTEDSCLIFRSYNKDKLLQEKVFSALDYFAQESQSFSSHERLIGFIALLSAFYPQEKLIDKLSQEGLVKQIAQLFSYDKQLILAARKTVCWLHKYEELRTLYGLKKCAHALFPRITLRLFLQIYRALYEEAKKANFLLYEQAERARLLDQPEPPIIRGTDSLVVGLAGKERSEFLALAYDIQIKEEIRAEQELKEKALSQLLKKRKK